MPRRQAVTVLLQRLRNLRLLGVDLLFAPTLPPEHATMLIFMTTYAYLDVWHKKNNAKRLLKAMFAELAQMNKGCST